jgi:light-harvesting complex 1 beta chain
MTNVEERPVGSLTGLTPEAAKEFHGLFMLSFIVFTVIAIVAHVLVWNWRPWLPSVNGYAELEGVVHLAAAYLPSFT